jgi:hypothetical protein
VFRPRDRLLSRREGVREAHVDRIEELRLDAVRAVVAELDTPRRMRPLDVKLEQQLAGLRLPWRGAFWFFGEVSLMP